MLALVQRVKKAGVFSESGKKAFIGKGLIVYLGVKREDTEKHAFSLASRILNARLFDQEDKSFEKSVIETEYSIMVISQFTLYADTKRGRRPDFGKAMKAEDAKKLFDFFFEKIREGVPSAQKGDFGAHMDIEYINDGPVSILYEEV
ncbi:D-tyrosyl-tRNA(Tyr) deacylase [candidate division WOR-3 bacterium]|nr:D-tyrosyl-tRNA(Tyr) deacylase [candidate division WOR-3 bacterium]